MNDLFEWANQWGISAPALYDLQRRFRVYIDHGQPIESMAGLSEAAVSNNVRMEASRNGLRLWRNNVGADKQTGLRWGLANDSPQVNKVLKSSDLIGIGPDGQFVAREAKPHGWVYTGTEHEQAQLNFIKLVCAMGGDACFVTGPGSFKTC